MHSVVGKKIITERHHYEKQDEIEMKGLAEIGFVLVGTRYRILRFEVGTCARLLYYDCPFFALQDVKK